MTDDEQDFFNKSIGKLEKEIIALKKEYNAECHRADELEDSLHISWQNESKLKKQLDIAIKALEDMARQCDLSWYQAKAEQTLKAIEDMRND